MTVKQKTQRAVWLLGIAALVLVWCSKSSPLYAFNDWMDANIFFTMGKSMLHGRVLYRDVFDHKGPVLYLLYGLAACVDNTGFGGVLLLETAAFAAFLWLGLRSAEVICGRALHPAWTALPAAAVAASRAFSHGGSAEELLLPLLAAALFGAVSTLRASRPMPLRRVVLHGFLAGCALWLKYTVLGFYLVWAVLLAVLYLRRGWRGPLGRAIGAYLGGMALATLPWVVYFGVQGALGDWFTCYFYDNLFLYKGEGGGAAALAQHLWWAVRDALPVAVLLAAFLLWAGASPARCGGSCGGPCGGAGLHQPDGRVSRLLWAGAERFCPAGAGAADPSCGKVQTPRRRQSGLHRQPAVALALVWCVTRSPNRALRWRTADSMPQRRFARQINGASLLNYGTLDGGFYTAAGVLPPCRYFCVTNMPLDDQWAEQNALLAEGGVDYVVALTGDLGTAFPALCGRGSVQLRWR